MKKINLNLKTRHTREQKISRFNFGLGEIADQLKHFNDNVASGTDSNMTHAEINLLQVIRRFPNSYVTSLASKQDVTKGAISQILMKLETKQLIVKTPDPSRMSRKLISTTKLGEDECIYNDEVHLNIKKYFADVFDCVCDDELEKMLMIIEKINISIKRKEISEKKEKNDL